MTASKVAAAKAARNSYGRLLAWLAWQWRDIAAAEDALAESFAIALERWPQDGVPDAPDAWLLRVAQRRLLMDARRHRLETDPAVRILLEQDSVVNETLSIADNRLRLMFVCTHPAIDASIRSALMLQTVLGLDAQTIASAFLTKPETMTKRLVRAKAKIRAAGIPFSDPAPSEWPERLADILEAIYGAYTCQWNRASPVVAGQLADEALFLVELLAALLPREPEALGLLALLQLCEARRPAQSDEAGRFIPLQRQDIEHWNHVLIVKANESLTVAASYGQTGPYQIEAAIQGAYVSGRIAGAVPWQAIVQLYEQLLGWSPTIGSRIAHAVAVAHLHTPEQGLELLEHIDAGSIMSHQPWWAARAHMLAAMGSHEPAAAAYERAATLSVDPALRTWLMACRDAQRSAVCPQLAAK